MINNPRCNMCGKELDVFDRQEGFRIGKMSPYPIGYGSTHDGEMCDCKLCIRCFDFLMGKTAFKINPFSEPKYSATRSEGAYEESYLL